MTEANKYMDLAREMALFTAEKDHKYNHAFKVMVDEYGFDYALSKLEEKLYRLKQLKKLDITDTKESFLDSLKDLWGYSLLGILYLEEEEENKKETHKQLLNLKEGGK